VKPGVSETTIARAVRGDEGSQRAIYETYHARAYRLAYLLLRDALDAEEVVQDAFVYALQNLAAYDRERASFWTWLRVILVSRCRNKRRRKLLPRVSLDELIADGQEPRDTDGAGDPPRAVARRDVQRSVYEALDEVSAGARDALILRYYEGLAYAAIGEMLGCTEAAARQRVLHGKRQLRELFRQREKDAGMELGAARAAEAR
jgi:RNA polymerase sigma-70 factor (ECF subfamily)